MSTPRLQQQTLYILDSAGRIVRTREPGASPGPAFSFIRGATACAWAVHADLPEPIRAELSRLAAEEPPTSDWRAPLRHIDRYAELVGGHTWSGPAFVFSSERASPPQRRAGDDLQLVEDIRQLARFNGWTAEELPDRAPIVAVMVDDEAVSICFCARRSDVAAEAGLETVSAFRGRGFGARVTAAWALAVQGSGRTPLYSTSWTNGASLAVARKLGLSVYATDWNFSVDEG